MGVEPESAIFSSKYGFEDSLAIKVGTGGTQIAERLIEKLKDPFIKGEKKVKIIRNLKARKEKDKSFSLKGILVKTKESGEWIKAQDVIFSSEYKPHEDIENLVKEGLLDKEYKFLDPVFIEDVSEEEVQNWKNFFTTIGVGTEKINVSKKLLQKLLSPYTEDWERERIIGELKRRWEEKADFNLKGIPVPVKTEKKEKKEWLEATEVFFSSEYQPVEDLERLVKEGLLDEELRFLDSSFIKDDPQGIRTWLDSFKEAGVGERLTRPSENQRFINKVSIKAAFRYEQEAQHVEEGDIEEVREHERDKGYDIQSKLPDGSPKYIEVKGLGKEGEVNLRKSQYRLALKEGKRTYIYIVNDALRYPVLYPIEGISLDSEEFLPSLQLSPSAWKKISQSPWRCLSQR